ncbi:MAG: tRNA dimethylallyltransferase [Candidatus Omnitrophica bacterium]|nr:tRNA dimethylallyltransferase [Candidatus Omnitrophota bacterium]
MPRENLYRRINERVDKMFNSGAVQEVQRLRKKKISQTASGIIGLKEIQMFLDGALMENEAKEIVKKKTRHYAKRQLTWFRKDKRLTWVEIAPDEQPRQTVKRILEFMRRKNV